MTRLHLIRHARPVVDAAVSASAWQLAVDDAPFVTLAASPGFPRSGWWVSSSEPKAVDTARRLRTVLGLASDVVQQTPALREMQRPARWVEPAAFDQLVQTSVQSPAEPAAAGWEPATSVLDRVCAEVVRQCEESGRDGFGDVVLVGHGTAWSLLVAAILDRPVDIVAWRRMRMPDWCVLDVAVTAGVLTGSLLAGWGAWAAG